MLVECCCWEGKKSEEGFNFMIYWIHFYLFIIITVRFLFFFKVCVFFPAPRGTMSVTRKSLRAAPSSRRRGGSRACPTEGSIGRCAPSGPTPRHMKVFLSRAMQKFIKRVIYVTNSWRVSVGISRATHRHRADVSCR